MLRESFTEPSSRRKRDALAWLPKSKAGTDPGLRRADDVSMLFAAPRLHANNFRTLPSAATKRSISSWVL